MKKHLIIALVLIMTMPAMAQVAKVRPKHGGSSQQYSLTISAPRGQKFWLFVDDVLQNENSVHSICITNMWDDDFYVRVELDNQQHNSVGQLVDLSRSKTLSLVRSDQCYGLESSLANVRPELTMDLLTQQSSNGGNGYLPMPHMPFGMSPQDYEDAYQLISKESFDSSRLTVAKQVASYNPMTASQILGICKLFSFENNKLEFAKYAYYNCVDKNKYYLLNEAFTYDASKRELDEFISEGR